MLMTRESPTEVPQYYVTHFSEGGSVRTERKISDFPHPYPTVRHVYHCRLAAFCVFSVPATGHQVSIIRSRISTTTSPLDLPHRQQMVMPQLADLQKEIIRYTRSDGVELNGTLYLPPGYDAERDGPLPALLWAYPREFKSKVSAVHVAVAVVNPTAAA